MKKWFAVLLALVGALAAFAGCSDAENFTPKTYRSGESAVEEIVVEVTDREVEIAASEDGQIHIEYFDSEKEFLEITGAETGRLTVRLVQNKEWTDFIGVKPSEEFRKVSVRVPDGKIVRLSASTTNESIRVEALSFAESVTLSSNGGDVVCERVGVGASIALTVKNGDITGTVVGAWDDFSITCTGKKGECNLPERKEGGTKTLAVAYNNGDVDLQIAA